jgi:protoporphyrinogen oxidase
LQRGSRASRPSKWKLKADKNYEAEFKLKGADVAAKFDVSGKWLETETTIPRLEVPESVSAALNQHFPGHKIVEAQTVVRWDDGIPIYEIHIANVKEVVRAQLTHDGRILNQSAKSK